VLVTGGSEGIGLAIAAGAMRLGARVSILARDPAKLAAARARLGDDVVTQSADVTRRDALRAAVDAACTRYGDCDILVPAAGGAEPGNFLEMDAETFRRQIDLNYLGVVDRSGPLSRRWSGGRVGISSSSLQSPDCSACSATAPTHQPSSLCGGSPRPSTASSAPRDPGVDRLPARHAHARVRAREPHQTRRDTTHLGWH
jgi:NAD(P)-dependent dehydrogenase (short-subunit alcohol dehydrogenase family)